MNRLAFLHNRLFIWRLCRTFERARWLWLVTFAALLLAGCSADEGGLPQSQPTAPAPSGITVRIDPAVATANPGASLPVTIQVQNASSLWGMSLKLTYDSTIVECTQPQEGKMPAAEIVAKKSCAAGIFEYIVSQKAPTLPASGSGESARLSFKCLKPGTSPLHLTGLKLVDRDGQSLPFSVADARVDCK